MRASYQRSSAIYYINPRYLRSLRVEIHKKSRDKAYGSHREHQRKTAAERAAIYDNLKKRICEEGFDPNHPIEILLNRKDGKDQIWQGHHRLAIAIELNLAAVPVRFLYDAVLSPASP